MKRTMRLGAVVLMMAHVLPAMAGVTILDRLNSAYNKAKNKISDYAVQGYMNEKMDKAYSYLPKFVKGESEMDIIARIMLVGSLVYIAGKPFFKSPQEFKKIILASLGWLSEATGIDINYKGKNITDPAKEAGKEVAQYFNEQVVKIDSTQKTE